jgi:succinoglycan biosynthesis transport protein ExoP
MAQYEFHITDYERIFRKQYKIVIVFVGLAVGFSVLFAKMKPPFFQTAATVKIDRNTPMGLTSEAVIYGSWDNIETQTKVITSFPVLVLAAKKLGMVPDSLSEEEHPENEAIMSKIRNIGSSITTELNSGTNIVTISASSDKPQEARDKANAIALAYKDFSVNAKKMHAIKTKLFIEEQLSICRADLAVIEDDIKAFEESRRIPSLEDNAKRVIADDGLISDQIQKVDDAIAVIRSEADNLMRRFTNPAKTPIEHPSDWKKDTLFIKQQMSWVSEFTDEDEGLRKLNTRLIELQIMLDDQRSYYTPDHPTIKDIEKKISETIDQVLIKYKEKIRELTLKRATLELDRSRIAGELRQLPADQMTYARLQRRLQVTENLNQVLTTKLQEALIAEAGVVDDVTIMSLASMPDATINQSVPKVAGVGIFLGLILGIIFAVVREMFDTSIGTIEDVERTMKLSVLAVIPHISIGEQRQHLRTDRKGVAKEPLAPRENSFLVTHFNSKDPTAEAYRILRTNIEYLSFEKPLQTILLTSATMQEGKSTTISNLAVVFAQQNKKVLLLELNLRRPSMHRVFGYEKGPGVTDILIDRVKWTDCVNTVTDIALGKFSMDDIFLIPGLDNLHILGHGHTPPNPTELISSKKMDQLIVELRDNFDVILVDGPPLLPVADSLIIAKKVDGVVLVYMVGNAPRSSLRLTKERLETVNANILGLVLNDIRPETSGTTYSAYSMYAYTADKSARKKKRFGFSKPKTYQ